MSGRKSKALRRVVANWLSSLPFRVPGHMVAKIYRRAKRSYRDGACALLLPGMGR